LLINFSNHPSDSWSEAQLDEAKKRYGPIEDHPFPAIDPHWPKATILTKARAHSQNLSERLQSTADSYEDAVHVMGELTFCFALVLELKAEGITCIASTTHRNVVTQANGDKQVSFQFVRFRAY